MTSTTMNFPYVFLMRRAKRFENIFENTKIHKKKKEINVDQL